MMKNADLSRLINSDEVQSVVNAPKEGTKPQAPKANPLRNKKAMDALNPAAEAARKRATTKQAQAIKKKAALTEAKRKGTAKGEGRQGRRRRQGQVLQGADRRRLVSRIPLGRC